MFNKNYWNTVKHEYNDSKITKELYYDWVENSDCITMTQIYTPIWSRGVGIPCVYIPGYIKINYNK